MLLMFVEFPRARLSGRHSRRSSFAPSNREPACPSPVDASFYNGYAAQNQGDHVKPFVRQSWVNVLNTRRIIQRGLSPSQKAKPLHLPLSCVRGSVGLKADMSSWFKHSSHLIHQEEQQYRGAFSPAQIVRRHLEREWQRGHDQGNQEREEFFDRLEHAWDALAYERYEIGSDEERHAGTLTVGPYYRHTQEPTIRFSDPMQVRILDALAEAVGILHQRGQTEIEIPEKLKNYLAWQRSKEYEELWHQARARRRH